MYRRALDTPHTMSLTLLLMITDKRAHDRQRIVCKEHHGRIHHLLFLKQTDHLRNICIDRAPRPAPRILALKTPIRLIYYMYCHKYPPLHA